MSKKNKKRKRTAGDFIRGVILIVALAVFLFSGYQLYLIYSEYKEGTDDYDRIRDSVFRVKRRTARPRRKTKIRGRIIRDRRETKIRGRTIRDRRLSPQATAVCA